MAVLNRIILDFVTEEEISDRRLQSMAREASESVHIMAEPEDGVNQKVVKMHHGHQHNSSYNKSCRFCISFAEDERNNDNCGVQ